MEIDLLTKASARVIGDLNSNLHVARNQGQSESKDIHNLHNRRETGIAFAALKIDKGIPADIDDLSKLLLLDSAAFAPLLPKTNICACCL